MFVDVGHEDVGAVGGEEGCDAGAVAGCAACFFPNQKIRREAGAWAINFLCSGSFYGGMEWYVRRRRGKWWWVVRYEYIPVTMATLPTRRAALVAAFADMLVCRWPDQL